ncbi:enoyl-CoA hydratase [Rhodococcus antarcticus]|uniref:Enoyl-CoA hydratase n=1 Tax=Rhodococcus antarcticus TaxID=2987751 RepID=A0ABY6P240_9NOCA|nr:enoyl-CoA hydratase [Rhodococcus antarcticus]UZJ25288.1 enoyl-CoA hydratase [Rhodococcus antarcticus]
MTSPAAVHTVVTDHVAVLTVSDPDRRNALTLELSAALADAVASAEADTDVHAVVLTGAGSAFCAGGDLGELARADAAGLERIYAGFVAVARCTLPTIAAVNGAAVGAGLNLSLAADVRLVGPRARFDARFLQLGLHPGGGMTWMLQRAVGPQVARAMVLLGTILDADAAVAQGLALSRHEDVVAAAVELAAVPAAAPRELVLATKASMRATAQPGLVDTDTHAAALATELGPQAHSATTPEFAAKVAALQQQITRR